MCLFLELSIEKWPVTGAYTGITYHNMYCAICNGALDPITDHPLPPDKYNVQKALQFWTMEIYCDNNTIELIENDKLITSPETLENLIQDRFVSLASVAKRVAVEFK